MKKLLVSLVLGAVVAFVLVFSGSFVAAAIPQMINYQGMLTDNLGTPLNGNFDILFKIYNASSGGTKKWEETQSGVSVSNGLFNVILGSQSGGIDLDFSEEYWLDITVGGEQMPSRLRFTSVGYAYRALVADSARVATPGSGSHWSVTDSVLYSNNYWGIARGSAGNVLYGNDSHTHINLGVSCTTGSSGQARSYCTVGGGEGNTVSGNYATVSGGWNNTASDYYATVSGGGYNTASGDCATVSGGASNIASGWYATVSGGKENTASVDYATVSGGYYNTASDRYATVSGGHYNTASGSFATVSGGWDNTASGTRATVSGGYYNTASGDYATVGGGRADTVAGYCSFAAGYKVRLTSDADYTFAFGSDFTTSTPNAVIFHNSANEIKVGIGVTNPGNILTVQQGSTTDPIADAWDTYSSIRWKENINPIENALDKVLALRGVYFDWRESKKHDIGMIAEEVGEVVPEVVTFEENGVDAQGLNYARLTALLVEAIKEQQQEIEKLKAQLELLKR